MLILGVFTEEGYDELPDEEEFDSRGSETQDREETLTNHEKEGQILPGVSGKFLLVLYFMCCYR